MATETVDIPPAELDTQDSVDTSDSETELSEQDTRDFEAPENLSKLHLSPIETLQAKYIAVLEKRLKSLEYTPSFRSHVNAKVPKIPYIKPCIKRIAPDRWRKTKPSSGLLPPYFGTLLVGLKSSIDSTSSDSTGKAHRLAINSDSLLKILSELTGETFTSSANVLVYPFKHLILHEDRIRRALVQAEENYVQAIQERDGVPSSLKEEWSGERYEQKNSEKLDPTTLRQLQDELKCLVEFMEIDMADIFKVRKQIHNGTLKCIAFEHLWLLFEPGNLVIQNQRIPGGGLLQAFTVLSVTGGRISFDPSRIILRDPRPLELDEEDDPLIYALLQSASRITPFVIDCFYVNCDGQQVGPKPRRIVIPPYVGERSILALEVYPAKFDPAFHVIMVRLLRRGTRFISVVNGSHRWHSGMSVQVKNHNPFGRAHDKRYEDTIRAEEVHSEVMVDQAAGCNHFQNSIGWRPAKLGGGILVSPTPIEKGEIFDQLPERPGEPRPLTTDVVDDSMVDIDRRSTFLSSTDLLQYHTSTSQNIPETQLRLLPDRICGYATRNRKWLALRVELLNDVTDFSFDKASFRTRYEDLILPRGHKKLLQALVTYYIRDKEGSPHFRDSSQFTMDVVHGKGEGLIILLHGPPGVGKTSTAECVAAQLKRPILPITCGDLGSSPKELEQNLDNFCTLAHKWRCVLLLDEADVFLSKREKGDIDRNARVGVFLRVLEYYPGVLILTSNRVGEIDEAFRSRIHICLFYPKLDKLSVTKVWEKNINRVRSSDINIDVDEDEIRHFYELLWLENEKNPSRHWNGRQIKNAFQTAIALAHWGFYELPVDSRPERPVLRAKHFKRVGQTSAHFDDYIGSVYGLEEQDAYSVLAAREEVRRDAWPTTSFKVPKETRSLFSERKRMGTLKHTLQEDSDTSENNQMGFEVDKEDGEVESDEETDNLKYLRELANLRKKYARSSKVVK